MTRHHGSKQDNLIEMSHTKLGPQIIDLKIRFKETQNLPMRIGYRGGKQRKFKNNQLWMYHYESNRKRIKKDYTANSVRL